MSAIDYRQGPHINTVRDPRDASASWTLTGVVLEGSGRASRHDVARVEAVATLVANRLHISGPERKRVVCRHVSADIRVESAGPARENGRMPTRVSCRCTAAEGRRARRHLGALPRGAAHQ